MLTKVKTDYLINLSEAKAHLRVDTTDEDAYISQLIKAAVQAAEQYINKDIAQTENTLVIEYFNGYGIEVDEGHLQAITSLKDESNTDVAYENLMVYDSLFKLTVSDFIPVQTITLKFNTGFTDSTLPPLIRQAIYVKIADLYDSQRSGIQFNTMQYAKVFETLLNPFMAMKLKYIDYNRSKY
jgi:uncharacterized phiE125 gp8 family phage protein